MTIPPLESASTAFLPKELTLPSLTRAARGCTACPLYQGATQTVFGEGPVHAQIMLVGEQPGDYEDRKGRPFVGPAGQVLDEVLAEVGIPRDQVYVTNTVKHFKYKQMGKRRIHQKPNTLEVIACRGWLEAEMAVVAPPMLVALGATAAQAFMGPNFRLTQSRGQIFQTPFAPWWMATFHPSSILRAPDEAARRQQRALFTEDLARAAARLASSEQPPA